MESKELPIGTTLQSGKYTIKRTIGIGGFGITYYVRHNVLGQYFAVKEFFINGYCVRNTQNSNVLPQGISDAIYEKYLQKFIEEAQTLARLDHPNIVKITDVFQEKNTAFIVMPFLEGKTLQQLVEQKSRLDYETAVNYIAQLSDAVDYIHQHNILHRDIKPDNIIITPDNKAILIDFGSAREFIHDKTQQQTAIYTQGYAPLEQYSSNSRKGSYSDIYSLGATFYFALTGQKPMDATMRTMETMQEPKALLPSIPDEANRTIMKAMQLNPENRYQKINEFMEDLLHAGERERATSTIRQLSNEGHKGISSIGIRIGIFAVLAIMFVGFLWLSNTVPTTDKEKEQIQVAPTNPVPNEIDYIKGKLDSITNDFIYDIGEAVSLKLPDGTEWRVGQNSSECKLFTFLNSPDVKVDTDDKSKGWITLDRLYFNTGTARLTSNSDNQLKNIVMILKFFPNSKIKIGGFTDNTGTDEINYQISTERARITAEGLITLGIDADRVAYEGYGSQHPVCPGNDTDMCRALNRRIAIRVTNK